MVAKAFKNSGYLSRRFIKHFAQDTVADAETLNSALGNSLKDSFVVGAEEIETTVAAAGFPYWAAYLVDSFDAVGRVVYRRKEVEVTAITGTHQVGKVGQAVDRLAHVGRFVAVASITMFHPTVVFEERYIVCEGLDTENTAEFVIHLDATLAHAMTDGMSFDTSRELAAEFAFVTWVEPFAQEHGDIVGFDGVRERPDQFLVNRIKGITIVEDDVRGVFGLHNAPVNARVKPRDHWAKPLRDGVQQPVQSLDREFIGELLRFLEVVDVNESVFNLFVRNALFIELASEPVVSVEIELKAEGRPSGDAKITEAELFVDEVDVIMQASTGIILEESGVGFLVVPGLEGSTGFHSGENMDDARLLASVGDDFLDAFVLSEVFVFDELDVDFVFSGNGLDIVVDFIPHRSGPLFEVKNADSVDFEKTSNGAWMANVGQGSLDDNAIETAYGAHDYFRVTFTKLGHNRNLQEENRDSLLFNTLPSKIQPCMVPACPG